MFKILAGIKRGKRKRQNRGSASFSEHAQNKNKLTKRDSANNDAASSLREVLSTEGSGDSGGISMKSSAYGVEDVVTGLQRRGKISTSSSKTEASQINDEVKVLMMSDNNITGSGAAVLEKEDFRSGYRKGKLKQNKSYLHSNADKTISEMIEDERQSKREEKFSMDEIAAKNIVRLGSHYKGSRKKGPGLSSGVDEEDYGGDGGVDMKIFTESSDQLSGVAKYAREKSRLIAKADKELAITNRCWWWIESASFRKHMLLSLGDHVSLVLSPSHLSLVNFQCILVPVKYTESFVLCGDEIWDEIERFQTSIREMFRKDNMGVLFFETVLPSKSLWQTRLDVIPVPRRAEEDAAMYFKSALTEQAEEWGTHTKILPIKKGKGLRQSIPKGFDYFYIEWEGGGFAQIIETNSFPKDFALDTIAGMMDLNPVRFKRKQRAPDHDKSAVLSFLTKWKSFDWTLTLDNNANK